MSLADLLQTRVELYEEINKKLRGIREEYEPKLAAINLQIDRENKKGVRKRINQASKR